MAVYIQKHQILDRLKKEPLADISDMLDNYVLGQLEMEDQDKTEQEIRDDFWQQWAEVAEHRIDNQALKLLLLPLVESKPEEEQETFSFLFPAWRPDIDVLVDEKRQHEGLLYKCLQAHRTQSDWLPDATPALWARVSAPGVIEIWIQPSGEHDAYNTGDKVIWPDGGPIWESTIDANVWEPGVDGWVQVE